jgi:hypothetical protein
MNRRAFLAAAAWAGLTLVPVRRAAAEGAELTELRILQTDDSVLLDASFAIELNNRLEETIGRGVALYFVIEFELYRPRWYWFDEKAGSGSHSSRIAYNALTRQYRVSTGGLHLSYATLAEALSAAGRVYNERIADKTQLALGSQYAGQVRLRLDLSQLPKPFQVNALNSRDWNLASEWKRFSFVPTAPAAQDKR